jgi:ATP/maltotriose-dependent transcriptional regulator MalT/DNA-binding SARP family transcriptional activator
MTVTEPRLIAACQAVDTRETRSVGLGPSNCIRGRLPRREPVPVGPGRPAPTSTVSFPIGGEVVHEFPLQLAKVQRPPLRRETLKRDRLLDWLRVKIHHRIVLVTAEAGYGKTTLLADFARHSRRPTMWYRLDEEDRNWVSFLHYLVAAGREIQPGFAAPTKELLDELGAATGPSRDTIVATFMRDLQSLGPGGAALVIDDFHLVDDVPDIRVLVRELVARAPERLTLVFISRQAPSMALSRLRTLGEVAELGAADLRFDLSETERLFRETYGRPLEPDVLADLTDRTEGWAASLQLVNAALRDRSPGEVRAFVHGLNGAHGELYDYLAEEVVGELGEEAQQFLMRTSLLQAVDPALTEIVAGIPAARARDLIGDAERLGLLSGRGRGGPRSRRYHPLVREFLGARLKRAIGDEAVRDLHRTVARHASLEDWRLAAYHYAAAEDFADLHAVVREAVPTIMGGGEFALAESYVQQTPSTDNAAFELLLARMELHRGRIDSALAHGEAAVDIAMRGDDTCLADHALSNLVTVLFATGAVEKAWEVAELVGARTQSPVLRSIAQGVTDIAEGSMSGDLQVIGARFLAMAQDQERRGLRHYAGISWLNLAEMCRARGDARGTLEAATRAFDALSASSAGFEVEAARVLRGWALAHACRWDEATNEFRAAQGSSFDITRAETLSDIADTYLQFGDRHIAEALINRSLAVPRVPEITADQIHLFASELALRHRDQKTAVDELDAIALSRPHPTAGFASRVRLARANVAVCAGIPDADRLAAAALHAAARQGAQSMAGAARVLQGTVEGGPALDAAIEAVGMSDPSCLSMVVEAMCARLGRLGPTAMRTVQAEALRRPDRWREAMRLELRGDDTKNRHAAAVILDQIGTIEDVGSLRKAAKTLRGAPGGASLGRGLARRLAPLVFVEDQGRVQIQLGSELIPGTAVRRKVLAMLCFLLARPKMSATRDHVLDALWPDLEPEIAANSLNQTVYFLRRVFEPAFTEETSPNYVHHDSDVLWLDGELVSSRSIRAREAIRSAEVDASPDNVEAVSAIYGGRFALDFAYEEWAVPYRDSLHAAYLEVIEKAVMADTNAGAFDRAIGLARRATEVDPDAEQIELSLLKLCRRTGAHAAAAKLYAHYAAVLRNDLGIEPPPLDSL